MSSSENTSFSNIHNPKLKAIIAQSLDEMVKLLEETTCISDAPLADQLNEIKKRAFEELYAIGHETMDRELSEEVLKAIRALQDAYGQIIVAISPMDIVAHCIKNIWVKELSLED